MPFGKSVMTVAAIIIRGDDVLMVREPRLGELCWGPPGGTVEPGELLTEAVVREVREETGLRVADIGPLAVVSQHFIPAFDEALTAFAFLINAFDGSLEPADPDGLIEAVSWMPIEAAASELERFPFPPGGQPMADYLRRRPQWSTTWMWRVDDAGSQLIARTG